MPSNRPGLPSSKSSNGYVAAGDLLDSFWSGDGSREAILVVAGVTAGDASTGNIWSFVLFSSPLFGDDDQGYLC